MADIHDLILIHGRENAIQHIDAKDRKAFDIAVHLLAHEGQALGFAYSGFCLTSLPHRRLPDDQPWDRKGPVVSLFIEPGSLPVNGNMQAFGVPYGAAARMILIYLQTMAIRERSPEVMLGTSLYDWLMRMHMGCGGKNYRVIRDQAARLSACRLTFYWKDARGADLFRKDAIVDGGIMLQHDDHRERLWQDTVRLSDTFFRSLVDHPVPIWEPAIRAISGKSMAIDIYVWLAYRLHFLKTRTPVSWLALHQQFGAGFSALKHFKPEFVENLKLALAAYPDAQVNMSDDGTGIDLWPSRPPVPEALIGR